MFNASRNINCSKFSRSKNLHQEFHDHIVAKLPIITMMEHLYEAEPPTDHNYKHWTMYITQPYNLNFEKIKFIFVEKVLKYLVINK